MESDNDEQKEMEEVKEQKTSKVKKKAKHEAKEVMKEEHTAEHAGHSEEHHSEQEKNMQEMHEQKSMWNEMGTWRFIAIVAALLLVVSIFTNGFGGSGATLSEDEAVQKTLNFVNLLQPDLGATSSGSEDVGDLYKISLLVSGQQFESYITKDGRLLFPQGYDLNTPTAQNAEVQQAPVVDVSADDDPVKGNANAPVTIIEFSDFQCPFCAKFFTETLSLIDEKYINTGKVKLVYRDFPLENIHPQATPAAQAAECADEQGKYYEYHDKLFENQQLLSLDNYKRWAVELGLDAKQFNDCVDSKKYASEVQKDLADGSAAGVTGTPAFFINGKSVSGAQPFTVFEALIEAELAASPEDAKNDEVVAAPAEEPLVVEGNGLKKVRIEAKKYRFTPSTINVAKGTAVQLDVTSTDVDFLFVLPDFNVQLVLKPGKTSIAEFVASKTGTFEFTCDKCNGKESVMKGKIVVE